MFDFEEKQSENKKEEQIDDFLKLRHTVRPMEANDLNDINAVRNAMEKIGTYKGVSPTFYERSFMDKPLEESIRSYQKMNNLTVDGRLEPKGETETNINKKLSFIGKQKQDCLDIKKHYDRLKNESKDDGEKHRELSCRAAQKGGIGFGGILALGAFKEVQDFKEKAFNRELRERYGGVKGVIKDGIKDMNNNLRGAWHGYFNKNEDCEQWAKKNRFK
ncbi:MAG: hypothetical protein IJY17_03180 [Alphaproteobacteria bacterium]|nr:hypothetical protein [Alphaproteobacteria bacterium]